MRSEVRAGRREAVGDRGARSMRGRPRLQTGGRPRGGAHVEHLVHGRDAGGVEAQRLVEHRRALPRVERRAYGAGRGAGGGRWRFERRKVWAGKCTWVGVGLRWRSSSSVHKEGKQGTGEVHRDHVAHVRDLGRVEAQRLVERPRPLPTRKEGTYDAERGKRAGRREVAAAQAARTGWAREKGWWPRHAWSARRTWSAWL